MTNKFLRVTVLGGTVLCASAFAVGGWAAVTVDDVPEYLVAGKPVTLSFVVRQHGHTPLGDLSPTVVMTSSSSAIVTANG